MSPVENNVSFQSSAQVSVAHMSSCKHKIFAKNLAMFAEITNNEMVNLVKGHHTLLCRCLVNSTNDLKQVWFNIVVIVPVAEKTHFDQSLKETKQQLKFRNLFSRSDTWHLIYTTNSKGNKCIKIINLCYRTAGAGTHSLET